MGRIRIEVRRSGGFGGISLPPVTLDTSTLPESEALEVAGLVEAAEQAKPVEPERRARDLTTYDLAIDDDGRTWHATLDDVTMPPEVRALVERVLSP